MQRKLVKPGLLLHFSLAVYCLLPGIIRAQSGPTVWAAPSLQRVGRTDAPGASTQAQISAAKGEYESFQIVVRAPSGNGLTNINVAVSDLTGPSGQIIAKSNLTLYREQYVNVTSSSPDWGGSNRPLSPGWYADGLIPFVNPATGAAITGATLQAVPYNLAAGTNQPFWVDVLVPRTAAAGYYTGSFTVSSSQGTVSGQISLHVWNFTLPMKPTLKSSFAYFQAGTLAAQQELLRNRVMPLSVSASNEAGLISGYGLKSNNVGPWSGADVATCVMSAAPSVSQFQAAAANHQTGLYLFDYSADEVDNCPNLYPILKQWAYNMHQAGIKNLVTMAPVTALFDDGSGTGRSAVDDWVVLPGMYNNSVSTIQQAIQKGDSVWSYNTLVQDSYSPKWEIDFAPINFRVQPGFINQSLNLTGLLYWKVDDWSSDPWNNVNNAGKFSSNNYPGEGMLVYPGQTVGITGVAPSIRLKWIRDGVDDYEYIDLLKKAGQGAWAIQIAQTMGPDWTSWTRDTNALESAREQLGQKLDTLGGGSGSAPSAPGSPSPGNGATAVSTTPTLSWAAGTGATSYDVYFGSLASPSLVGNVTGTSYKTATLAASAKYYWKVVAKNSVGSTSSTIWSFTTNPTAGSTPPPTSSFNPIRVHAGGSQYTDPQGQTWSADYGYSTSNEYTTGNSISNTNAQPLYQTERWASGGFQYRFGVPNGTYSVTLKFAEIYFSQAGQRVFSVAINGQTVLSNFDIVAQARGANIALDKQFSTNVTNGQITIQFTGVVQNPKVSAIQILNSSALVRVHAGGGTYTDSQGHVWNSDYGYSAGNTYGTGNNISNTSSVPLYQSERWNQGPFQYQFSVPNGPRTVTLKFAEIYFSQVGQRVFNIVINGQTVLSNFDVVAQAGGAYVDLDRQFTVNVANGTITIQFIPVVQNPKISAIEID